MALVLAGKRCCAAADTFNSIDTNSDGVIDRAELDQALQTGQLQLPTAAQVTAQVSACC